MSIQIPDKEEAFALWLAPHYEAIPENRETKIFPAIALFWSLPKKDTHAVHHHCTILEKFSAKDTEAEAMKAALQVLNNPEARRLFMALIIDGITDIEEL